MFYDWGMVLSIEVRQIRGLQLLQYLRKSDIIIGRLRLVG
jgi:hypothetical protein